MAFTVLSQLRAHVVCRVVEAEDEVTPLRLARIDAARGIGERIEYEVPADPAGDTPLNTHSDNHTCIFALCMYDVMRVV